MKGLGNLYEKVDRISFIAKQIFKELNDSSINLKELEEAARYSKHDLCSEIVNEFPELQGIMGGKYLLSEGYSENVSLAVAEHYYPRFYKDRLPSSPYGAIVALADKLETIISIFVIGKRPSGSSDPYAIRRNLNGIIQIMWQYEFNLKFDELIPKLVNKWKLDFINTNFNYQKVLEDLNDYISQRIISHLEDLSYEKEVISSTCESENLKYHNCLDIFDIKNRIKIINKVKAKKNSSDLINVISRYSKLAVKGNLKINILSCESNINQQLFEKNSELLVFNFLKLLENLVNSRKWDYVELINLFEENLQVLKELFDSQKGVLIMSENIKLRNNRLNLLCLVRNYSLLIADFTLLNS
tara:strand:- start:22 stop:1092 length:1071 start_codon:yes stop_codon:yes gene_type:complete